VEGSFCFVEDERVGATADDGDGLLGGFDARDTNNSSAAGLGLFDEIGCTEFVFCEGVDVGNGFAAGALGGVLVRASQRRCGVLYLANELNLITLNVFDRKNTQLRQEMQTQIINSIA
jgi:hypothetical protein